MFGMGGAGLRDISFASCDDSGGGRTARRWGRLGRECVDVFDGVRFRSYAPSKFGMGVDEGLLGMKGGAMSLRAAGLGAGFVWGMLVDELVLEVAALVPLKSTVWALAVPLAGGGSGGLPPILLTSTQSGSGDGVNGLLGLFGFGKWSFEGGWTRERAGSPLSSHHFLRSELAGGSPGSTLSYPSRSSSSLSPSSKPPSAPPALVSPTTSLL